MNIHAIAGVVVDEDPITGSWRVWYLSDRSDPSRREHIASAPHEDTADWIRRALNFWIDPKAGQEDKPAHIRPRKFDGRGSEPGRLISGDRESDSRAQAGRTE